jgi:sugar-specific transcriptional regulator TrmB
MFVLVSGKNMVIKKLSKLIAKAESSIYVKTSWRRFSKVHYFIDLLMEACSRGVKIRFIVETPPKNTALEPILGLFNKNKNCEVRFIPYFPDTILTLFDRKEVLIISNPKAELTESKALWSNSQSLLASMHKFYEVKWIEARKEPRYLRTRARKQ